MIRRQKLAIDKHKWSKDVDQFCVASNMQFANCKVSNVIGIVLPCMLFVVMHDSLPVIT